MNNNGRGVMSILRTIAGVTVCFTITSGNGMELETNENDNSYNRSLLITKNFSRVSSSKSKIQKSQKTFTDTSETHAMTAEQQVSRFLKQHPVKDISSLAAAIEETYYRRYFIKGQGISYRQYRDYLAEYLLTCCNSQKIKTEDLSKCIFVLQKILKQKVSSVKYQAASFAKIGIDSTVLSSVDIW
jgi:hypothetical protein